MAKIIQRTLAVLLIAFMLGSLFPALLNTAQAANPGARNDDDSGYLQEQWHLGLGSGLGEMSALIVDDIDDDGKVEMVVGNSQGFLHVLEYDDSVGDHGGFVETWQSVKMGAGAVRGMTAANIDEDPYLEIAVGFLYQGTDTGLVRILDGKTLEDEEHWRAGVGMVPVASNAEAMPYALEFADVVGDDNLELIVGSDTGHIYVLNSTDPNDPWDGQYGSKEYEVSESTHEGLWIKNTADDTPEGRDENLFGLAVGNIDDDPNYEIMTTTKAQHLLIYDAVTHELEFSDTSKQNVGGSPYGGLAADLDGDGRDEYIVGDDRDLKVYYIDEVGNLSFAEPIGQKIRGAKGLAAYDLYGDSDLELLAMTDSGTIYVLSYTPSGLTIDQSWSSGERFRAEGGHLAVAELPGGKTWVIHGGDSGVLRAWRVTASTHELRWSTHPLEAPAGGPYSIPNGSAYGTALGDIDGDGNLELVVGSQEGRVFAFDGRTRTLDWYSPVLDGPTVGLEIADVNGDTEPDLLVGTGNPLISRATDNETETFGQLHIFYGWSDVNDTYDGHWASKDNASIWGLAVGELDGSQYPEIALAAAQTYLTSGENPTPYWKGWFRVYGFNGTDFEQEYTTGDDDFNSLALGIAVGDANNDGINEAVVGVTNNSHDQKGRLYGYEYVSEGNYTQIFNLGTTNHKPFAVRIDNLDDSADGTYEIITGDAENPAAGSDTSRVSWYRLEGNGTPARKGFKEFTAATAWGLWTGDVDDDGETEFVVGLSNGKLTVYQDLASDNEEPYATWERTHLYSLSSNVGFYGGINQGDLMGDTKLELVVGSANYVWVFSFVGTGDRPDLEVLARDLTISWEPGSADDPTEDDDITFGITVYNRGSSAIDEWEVEFEYDNGKRIGGYRAVDEELAAGASKSINVTWYSEPRDRHPPGQHTITVTVKDPRPKSTNDKEMLTYNNEASANLTITAIPNDAPVVVAEKDKGQVWINEAVTLDAGGSHDTEDTGGVADDDDGQGDLWYRFYPRWLVDHYEPVWTPWTQTMTSTYWFPTPGMKEIKVVVHDERYKESEERSFVVEVISNRPPIADLTTNLSKEAFIKHDQFITLDASGSVDPDGRYELEYKFSTDRTDSPDSWLSDWGKEGSQVTLTNGTSTLMDEQGTIRKFTITNGAISFNYTLAPRVDFQTFQPQVAVREIIPGTDPGSVPVVWTRAGNVTINVERPENRFPQATAKAFGEDGVLTSDTITVKATETVTFVADEVYDPDGDKLHFVWNLLGLEKVGSPTNGQIIWAFEEQGTYTVTLTTTDGRGGQDFSSITVKVGAAPSSGDDEGLFKDLPVLKDLPVPLAILIVALPLVLGIAAGAVYRGRTGGEGEDYDYGEGAAGGVTILTCPTCASTIEVATSQRPVRVACGGCASEFILRE